jgi:hypothetical protein
MKKMFLFLILFLFLSACFGDVCGNYFEKTLISPDGEYVAILFNKDCGAVAPTRNNVVILRRKEIVAKKLYAKKLYANAFSASHLSNIDINWIEPNGLEIIYSGDGQRVVYANEKIDSVNISHVIYPPGETIKKGRSRVYRDEKLLKKLYAYLPLVENTDFKYMKIKQNKIFYSSGDLSRLVNHVAGKEKAQEVKEIVIPPEIRDRTKGINIYLIRKRDQQAYFRLSEENAGDEGVFYTTDTKEIKLHSKEIAALGGSWYYYSSLED